MPDPFRPLPQPDKKPGEVIPEVPETEAPERDFPEGPLPGMPISHDPLREPGPMPSEREQPPLD
ncbi:MAG: hypothetical protein JWQ89_4329 [Devosia sp.]|uniref:hypothetical protein n=1 Tax=Devosia sp. TaxID=1871048 RepID=UPI00262B2A85|nr:hypothetical protein [Devosia sp.]MDB5542602.1 hypothetical protein [Devosia sp.]